MVRIWYTGMKREVTAEALRAAYIYDPDTGHFYGRKRRTGAPLGHKRLNGYAFMNLWGRKYRLHRLAWLYVHGEWPKHQIDHINGDKSDNRIANLRDVPPIINSQNKTKPTRNSTTGFLGVSLHKKTGLYKAQVHLLGKTYFFGLHERPETAHQAYLLGCRILRDVQPA